MSGKDLVFHTVCWSGHISKTIRVWVEWQWLRLSYSMLISTVGVACYTVYMPMQEKEKNHVDDHPGFTDSLWGNKTTNGKHLSSLFFCPCSLHFQDGKSSVGARVYKAYWNDTYILLYFFFFGIKNESVGTVFSLIFFLLSHTIFTSSANVFLFFAKLIIFSVKQCKKRKKSVKVLCQTCALAYRSCMASSRICLCQLELFRSKENLFHLFSHFFFIFKSFYVHA